MLQNLWDDFKELIKEKVFTLFKKSRYILLIVIFIIGILMIKIIPVLEATNGKIESQELRIWNITLNNWFIWISVVTLCVAAGWALYQYRKNFKIKQHEKSVRIANEFATTIIPRMSIINEVIPRSILKDYIPGDEIDEELEFFDTSEVRRLFKNDMIIDSFKRMAFNNKSIDNLYHFIVYICNNPYLDRKESEIYLKDIIDEKQDWKKINDFFENFSTINDLPFHFVTLVTNTLNQLECICMDISTRAADSKYIYQSLHQMFLRSIRNVYLFISYNNTNKYDKYYINVIDVYNKWKRIYRRDYRREKYLTKKNCRKNNPTISQL